MLQPPQQKGDGDGGCWRAGADGLRTGAIVTDTAATDEGPLDRRARRRGPGGGGVGHDGGRRRHLVGRGAGGQRQGAVTQQSTRARTNDEQSTCPV